MEATSEILTRFLESKVTPRKVPPLSQMLDARKKLAVEIQKREKALLKTIEERGIKLEGGCVDGSLQAEIERLDLIEKQKHARSVNKEIVKMQ